MINNSDIWFIALAICCAASIGLTLRNHYEAAFAVLTTGCALWLAPTLVYGSAPQAAAATACTMVSLGSWWVQGGERRVANLPVIRTRMARHVGHRASQAITAAAAGDPTTGHVIIRQVLHRFGPAAAAPLTQVWAEVLGGFFEEEPDAVEPPVAWRFLNPTTHESLAVHEVPPRIRWSGWVITAATRHDGDMVTAMVKALPGVESELAQHLETLLGMSAGVIGTLNGADGQDAS